MKTFSGIVTSAKTLKTVTVQVTSTRQHPLYKKQMKSTNKFLCHDELGVKEGDAVTIGETKPMSARKRFKVVSKENKK